MNAIIRYFAKKYIRSILNDALKAAKEKVDIDRYRNKIASIIKFLDSLLVKLEDNEISEEEADAIIKEAQELI